MPAVTSLDPKKQQEGMPLVNGQLPYVQEGQLLPIAAKRPTPKVGLANPELNQQQLQPGLAPSMTPPRAGLANPVLQQPATQASIAQGSTDVMATAQQLAMQKALQQDPTMGLVQQNLNKLLQNPDVVSQKQIQSQIGQFDRNRANAMQAFQQQYADTANTGATRENAYNFAMQGATERSDLENKLQMEAVQKNREEMLKTLGLGMEAAKTYSGLDTEAFNRLIAARQAFEGERAQTTDIGFQEKMQGIDNAFKLEYLAKDQEGQLALTKLKGELERGILMDQQSFAGTQAALDRGIQEAKMKGDWASAENLTRMKGDIDAQAQKAQQEFVSTQNMLDRQGQMDLTRLKGDLDRGILLDQQNFAGTQAALDRSLQEALKKGDWASAEKLTALKGQIDAQAQTAQQNFMATQNALDRQGQMDLTELKSNLDMKTLLTQQDFQAAQASLDRGIQEAKMKGDWANAEKLTQMKGELDAEAQRVQNNFLQTQNALDRDSQIAIVNLKGQIDSGQLMQQQAFQKEQANLDRILEEYKANGDWANAQKITVLKGQIDASAQKAQNEWNTAERIGAQSWKSSENISDKQFAQAQQQLEYENKLALQNNDILAQKDIESKKSQLALTMQLKDFTQQEQMKLLDEKIAIAKANNDLIAQKELISYQSLKKLDEMEKAQGYEIALQNNKKNIDIALQNNDNVNAMGLLQAQQKFAQDEAAKDREIEWAKQKLQEKQVDMAKLEQQYNFLVSEAAADRANPDAAFKFIQGEMQKNGIQMEQADKDAVYGQLDADYKKQMYAFAISNPGAGVWHDAAGNMVPKDTPGAQFVGLTDDSAKLFNDFLNETYYGPDGKPITEGKKINPNVYKLDTSGSYPILQAPDGDTLDAKEAQILFRGAADPKSQNNQYYTQILNQSPTASIRISDASKNHLGGVPPKGSVVNVGGRVMIITEGNHNSSEGRNHQEFEIMDLSTGTKRVFNGLSNDSDSIKELDGWAADLT